MLFFVSFKPASGISLYSVPQGSNFLSISINLLLTLDLNVPTFEFPTNASPSQPGLICYNSIPLGKMEEQRYRKDKSSASAALLFLLVKRSFVKNYQPVRIEEVSSGREECAWQSEMNPRITKNT